MSGGGNVRLTFWGERVGNSCEWGENVGLTFWGEGMSVREGVE